METIQLNPETNKETIVEWEFIEISERHDSDFCEWLIEGTGKDGSHWTGATFTSGSCPEFENPIEYIYFMPEKNQQLKALFESFNPNL